MQQLANNKTVYIAIVIQLLINFADLEFVPIHNRQSLIILLLSGALNVYHSRSDLLKISRDVGFFKMILCIHMIVSEHSLQFSTYTSPIWKPLHCEDHQWDQLIKSTDSLRVSY